MSNFFDRQGQNLNKKILEVSNIERDETGTIISMEVEVIRNDGEGLTIEGTPLNAENLSKIVESVVNEEINTIPLTDLERVLSEKNSLKISQTVSDTLVLPTTGKRGCTIEWSVVDGEGISITDNLVTITQKTFIQNANVNATISYGEVIDTKNFEITVLPRETNDAEKLEEELKKLKIPEYVVESFELPIPTYAKVSWQYAVTDAYTVLGNRIIVERTSSNYKINLVGTFSYGTITTSRRYSVTVIGTNSYTPTEINSSLVQEIGNIKTLAFNVETKSLPGLYLEKEDVEDKYLKVNLNNNNSNNVLVQISETDTLNSMTATSVVEFKFNIKVYLDEFKEILIGTIPCIINYHFVSQTPED